MSSKENRPRASLLAMASVVCSLYILIPLVSQLAGIILGAIALVEIVRSQGTVRGKEYALAGILSRARRSYLSCTSPGAGLSGL